MVDFVYENDDEEKATAPLRSFLDKRNAVQDVKASLTPTEQAHGQALQAILERNVSSQQLYGESHNLELVKHIQPSLDEIKDVPNEIKREFWSVLNPGLSTSFNTDKDRIDFDLSMSLLRLSYQMNRSSIDIRPENIIQIDNVYVSAWHSFKRSVGSKENTTNFIKLLFTNIQQIISSSFSGSLDKRGFSIMPRDVKRFG